MQSRGPYIFNKDSIHNVKYACAIVLCIGFSCFIVEFNIHPSKKNKNK